MEIIMVITQDDQLRILRQIMQQMTILEHEMKYSLNTSHDTLHHLINQSKHHQYNS